jgi:hypothetical protein
MDFKTKTVSRDKRGNFVIIKALFLRIYNMNTNTFNKRDPK